MDKKVKIFCILSNLLGNRIVSDRLVEAMRSLDWIEIECLFVDSKIYKDYPVKWFQKLSSAIHIATIVRNKFNDEYKDKNFDILFINGYEITLGFKDIIKKIPTIVILDAVPSLAHSLIIKTEKSIALKARSIIVQAFSRFMFRNVFKKVNHYLTFTQWCKNALMKDYHIPHEKILSIYTPIKLDKWTKGEDNANDRFTILFVGNDFLRKGGDFLLNIFNSNLKEGNINLRIISNDPYLKNIKLPSKVSVSLNIPHEDMIKEFQKADIFVFPTRKDYLGIVTTEAMACGLPVIANDVGGLREFIKNDYNGYLMPYDSQESEWVEKIIYIYKNKSKRNEFSKHARETAEKMFNFKAFQNNLENILRRVSNKNSNGNKKNN